jgi:chemotaxis protein methyltransferase CheR
MHAWTDGHAASGTDCIMPADEPWASVPWPGPAVAAAMPDAPRFTRDDFIRIRELLLERTGIALRPEKQAMVYARLVAQVRGLGLQRFSDYVELLRDRGHAQWSGFISALTTNFTAFFREPHHFPVLAELSQRTAPAPFTVWSAGCATGEEPYSIAIALVERFARTDPPVRVVATDIDELALADARSGIYPADAIDMLGAGLRRRYFLRGTGEHEGFIKVRPELARLVSFATLNLCEQGWDAPGEYDAIFCRNVMIYLDRDVQRRVLERLAARLKPHGLLFTGHSENLLSTASDLFRQRDRTVYEAAPRHAA